MREKKRCIAQFTFYDRTGIQAYLEKMAAKGWMLEKVNNFYWQFRRIEPKEMHFAVTYFPKASEFDPEPGEDQKYFYAFCEQAGWKFIAQTAQLQIFYNEAENPVPIETDACVELENINRSAKGNFLIAQSVLALCALLQLGLVVADFNRDPLYVLGSNAKLFGLICWTAVLIMCMTEVVGYFLWYRKAKKAAETDGSFVKTWGSRKFQLGMLTVVLAVFVLHLFSMREKIYIFATAIGFCWVALLMVSVNLIKYGMKRLKCDKTVTKAVTFASSFILSFGLMGIMTVVIFRAVDTGWFEKEPVTTYEYNGHQFKIYHDELPLTVEDMMDAESDRYSYEMRVEDSWLLTHYEAYQNVRMNAELPEMRYDIFIPKLPGLYDFCLENIMEDFLEEDPSGEFGYCFMDSDASLWGAEKVYQYQMDRREMDRYLVCYEDYIVRITFYWTPEEEQLRTAGEKFTDFKDWASK
ncbi:MAG: DUF2812 domain-containing protein [Lachnospiraceae bacterium]|nr:DUF2812 domain-containing protein [Lachnospiraceae bacterium]